MTLIGAIPDLAGGGGGGAGGAPPPPPAAPINAPSISVSALIYAWSLIEEIGVIIAAAMTETKAIFIFCWSNY